MGLILKLYSTKFHLLILRCLGYVMMPDSISLENKNETDTLAPPKNPFEVNMDL
jgi:hypothetical protein